MVLRPSRNEPLPSSALRKVKTEASLAEAAPPSRVKQEEVLAQSAAPLTVKEDRILPQPSKSEEIKEENILSQASQPARVKKARLLSRGPRPQNAKKRKALSQVSATPKVKEEQLLLQTSAPLAAETEPLPKPSQFQNVNKGDTNLRPQVPMEEQQLSHFTSTQQDGNERVDHCLSPPSHIKTEHVPSSTSQPQSATSGSRGRRKRKSASPRKPRKPTNSTRKEKKTEQTTPSACDNSSKPGVALPPPPKRQRLQPPQLQPPSIPPLPAKNENPSSDEVVIVSERIVRKPSSQTSKDTQSQAITIFPQKSVEDITEPSSPAPVVTSQTEDEKERLIEKYALHVVERDEETKAITWVVCKFCPIYGCQRRQRQYIMGYHVPLCRTALNRHVEREHKKIWKLFKSASKEQKQDIFRRKRMPLDHVLQRRVAELKLSWGMKSDFTNGQQSAWRERRKIEQRWRKSSRARKKVTVKALADNLGMNLSASRDVNNKTGKRRESTAPREQSANDHMSKEEAQEQVLQRRKELRQEAEHLEIEMNDRGSQYEMMSPAAQKATMERRKRYERRVSESHNAA